MSTPISILIIEDSEDDAALLLELEGGGYEPIFARVDTAAAMQAALAKESWDIVIADYALQQLQRAGRAEAAAGKCA